MDGFRFETPAALLFLLLLPALVAFLYRSRPPATSIGSIAALPAFRPTWRLRGQRLLPALRIAAVALLVFALARPQRGEAVARTRGNGIDIVLAFDISTSMSLPFAGGRSRLSAAKDVLTRFVQGRTGDRVGLVVFQGSTLTLSPLTTDYSVVAQDIAEVDRISLADGTAIGVAMGQSVNLLRDSTAASRIVILLTDGENNGLQIQPVAAARIAEKLGVRVYTVGVVTRGRNPGQPATEVDEAALKAIADVAHGTYNRAEDPEALRRIYQEIDQLEKSRFEDRIVMRFDDIAPWLLAAAVALLAAEIALRHSWLRSLT